MEDVEAPPPSVDGEDTARQRTFDAALATSSAGTLFDVEASNRPVAPRLTQRLAMPSARLLAQFAAQNMGTQHFAVGASEGTVYVHGVFDLLSMGDIEFLKCARALGKRWPHCCSRIFSAITTDCSCCSGWWWAL